MQKGQCFEEIHSDTLKQLANLLATPGRSSEVVKAPLQISEGPAPIAIVVRAVIESLGHTHTHREPQEMKSTN